MQQFIVGQLHPRPQAAIASDDEGMISFDDRQRNFRQHHWARTRAFNQLFVTSGLGQNPQQRIADFASMEQHPHRGDRLHRLAQAHFVGKHRGNPRIQKGDSFQFDTGNGSKGNVIAPAAQPWSPSSRLQQIVQPVFQFNDVAGRPNAGQRRRWSAGRLLGRSRQARHRTARLVSRQVSRPESSNPRPAEPCACPPARSASLPAPENDSSWCATWRD